MSTTTKEITNTDDVIDVRDVIARVEELEDELADDEPDDAGERDPDLEDEREELQRLTALLEDLAGNGGDEEWRGVWYPVTLIRDTYFQTYAQELADDIGAIDSDAGWPTSYIDWEAAAEALQIDYTTTEYEGVTYWYR